MLKKESNSVFCTVAQKRVSLTCTITQREKRSAQRRAGRAPAQERTTASWVSPVPHFSFITPGSCKDFSDTHSARIWVTFMLYWTTTPVFQTHELYTWYRTGWSWQTAARTAAKRGVTDEHSHYFFRFQWISPGRLSELNLFKTTWVQQQFYGFTRQHQQLAVSKLHFQWLCTRAPRCRFALAYQLPKTSSCSTPLYPDMFCNDKICFFPEKVGLIQDDPWS